MLLEPAREEKSSDLKQQIQALIQRSLLQCMGPVLWKKVVFVNLPDLARPEVTAVYKQRSIAFRHVNICA